MKKRMQKWMGILLAVLLITSVFPENGAMSLAATAPSLSMSSKTLVGVGTAFTLSVKNLDNTKVKSAIWYTTNKSIVTVNASTGHVTSVGKGTAYIKCKITYKDGTILRPYCKVMVKIPATAIDITNTPVEGMNSFVITVGNNIDFNSVLTPGTASDLITYSIDNTNYATVDKRGIVTALKAGIVRLTATASLTKAGASTSLVKDTVNIQIIPKSASVQSAVLTDTTTLAVTFDSAINESTVMNDGDELLDSVSIKAMVNEDGDMADKLGDLTASLSSDGKTLTITSENAFNGLYGLHLTGSILTSEGTALTEYYKDLELYDTKAPYFKDYEVDDTGLIATLEFSEAMDFSNMSVSKVSLVKSSQTADTDTLSLLKTKTNYVKSDDSKSLIIDLSDMDTDDQNKTFAVVFSGLKDKAGNYPSNSIITAYVTTDTSEKAQAKLKTLTRTGYNILTATFTRAIKTPGEVVLSNGKTIDGEVDKDNNMTVNFTLDSSSAKLTGSQKVSIGYWDSYNVKDSDHTADKYTVKTVNFTVDKDEPVLRSNKLTTEEEDDVSYILTLTYDKNVILDSDSGNFTSRLVTSNDDIYPQKKLVYRASVKDKVVTVKLDKEQFDENGSYTITIPEGFVKDNFNNESNKTEINVNRSGSTGTELPAPESMEQSSDDPSIILVTFENKVDKSTAENKGNYTILGVSISKAELIENNSSGATVQLTLKEGTVSVTATYVVTIKGVKGYSDSYTEMEEYETTLLLYDNDGPSITKVTYSYPRTVKLIFDEEIDGTASFNVIQSGEDLAEDYAISGNTVTIYLNDIPKMNVRMTITPANSNDITDSSGNKATISTKYVTPDDDD
ncbi:MAG: Ig-like domain-containing protein [Anaerocolumna sp.]